MGLRYRASGPGGQGGIAGVDSGLNRVHRGRIVCATEPLGLTRITGRVPVFEPSTSGRCVEDCALGAVQVALASGIVTAIDEA